MNRTTAIGMATVLFGAMAAVAAGTAAMPDKAKLGSEGGQAPLIEYRPYICSEQMYRAHVGFGDLEGLGVWYAEWFTRSH